jgi:hypothetical protein
MFYYCQYHQDAADNHPLENEENLRRHASWMNESDNSLANNTTESDRGETTPQLCGVTRSEDDQAYKKKRHSMGCLASFLSCGIVIGYNELINHEGDRKVTDHLLTMIKFGAKLPNALIYDSACSLRLFWNKNYGGVYLKETPASKALFEMRLAVDRFHRKNHVHPMCSTTTNPDCAANGNEEIYRHINTGIAEQSFRYLTEFKLSLRRLAFPTSTLFSFLLLHLWNCRQMKISPDSFGLAAPFLSDKIKPMFLTYCIFETVKQDQATLMQSTILNDVEDENEDADDATDHHQNDPDILNYNCRVELDPFVWESTDEESSMVDA